MTIKELRKYFWENVADQEMRKEYRARKTQNDYSTDIRCAWVDFTYHAYKSGWITEHQYSDLATL